MQRDVEVEFDTTDKSGGFIGTLYINKTENAAVALAREGLATVHSFSAENLQWVKQLYDAEVSSSYKADESQFYNLNRLKLNKINVMLVMMLVNGFKKLLRVL